MKKPPKTVPPGVPGHHWAADEIVAPSLIALKAWMRKHYGPGVPYWYTVSRGGKVSLRHMPLDFAEASYAAPCALKPLAFDFALTTAPSRLALALMPEVCAPVPAPERGDETCSAHVLCRIALTDTS